MKRIDYVGAFLSIGGVTLFLVGLQFGGYQYRWIDGRTLGPLIVGGVMMLLFPLWEWKGAKYPMVSIPSQFHRTSIPLLTVHKGSRRDL